MTSVRGMSILRHTTMFSAALAFSLCYASAQTATTSDFSKDFSSSVAVSSTESSSNVLQAAEDGMPELTALPSDPGAGASGGGQYDNKSGHYSSGGIVSHLTYEAGGGFNAPTSDSAPYITWGWNFTVGGGYRFDQHFSTMIEYQFIDSKIPGAIIAQAGATGGYAHIWSFTLDPIYEFTPKSAINVYAVGGGGFYRKVTSFTNPTLATYCTYFYCGIVTQTSVVGHFSSNQGGWSIGGGLQHRFAGWNGDGKMKIFAEARYLDVLTPAVSTQPNGLGTTTVGANTKIIPVTIGLRW
jgi:Outer membrane protein beta-barrel domain